MPLYTVQVAALAVASWRFGRPLAMSLARKALFWVVAAATSVGLELSQRSAYLRSLAGAL
jgi:hypothetical protein